MQTVLRRTLTAALAALMTLSLMSTSAADARTERLAGSDRYLTSVAISQRAFPDGAGTVLLASGERSASPDAVVAGAAAAGYDYPVLLTRRDSVPDAVLAELERLDPATVIIIGGPSAVSTDVEEVALRGKAVIRLGGENRYATAALVSEWAVPSGPDVAYIASGRTFPDALAGGVAAGLAEGPVLLTLPRTLPPETMAHLEELQPRRIVVLGGPLAVSEAVADEAALIAPVTRISGVDRYDTSVAISTATFKTARTVFLANGESFPDALSGTPLAAQLRGPILLVEKDRVPAGVCAEVRRLKPTRVIALGGEAVVSGEVLERVAAQCSQPIHAPAPTPTPTVGPPLDPAANGS